MGLEKLLKKGTSTLSKDGSKPKSFDGQVSKLNLYGFNRHTS